MDIVIERLARTVYRPENSHSYIGISYKILEVNQLGNIHI